MKAFIGGFLGFSCKEGYKSPIIKKNSTQFFHPRVWMDKGLKDKSSYKISAHNYI